MGKQRDTSVQSLSKSKLKVLGSSSMVLLHRKPDSRMIFVKPEEEQWFSSYLVTHWVGLSPTGKIQDFKQHKIGLHSGNPLLLSGILQHWGEVTKIGYISGMQLHPNSSRRITNLSFVSKVWANIWTRGTQKFWTWSRCMHLTILRFGFKIMILWQACTKHSLTERDEPKMWVRQVNPQMQSSCELMIQHLDDSRSD